LILIIYTGTLKIEIYLRLSPELEDELGLTYHVSVAEMLPYCDVVTINCPLHPETEGLFDDKLISTMKVIMYCYR
jgi:lactate dehydrogenase-like 2-hydroxyacid dehydrogenase